MLEEHSQASKDLESVLHADHHHTISKIIFSGSVPSKKKSRTPWNWYSKLAQDFDIVDTEH